MPQGVTVATPPAPDARRYGDAGAGPPNAGARGNLCHVECSNRGLCDRSTGSCTCFAGYAGANCATRITYYGTLKIAK